MKLLLDTHTLLWAVDDPTQLGSRAVAVLQDSTNDLMLSAGSMWELAIKVGAKKLELAAPYRQWILQAIDDLGLTILPVSVDYAHVQTELPFHHKDPFDRFLVAQSLYEQIPIVSIDPQLDKYGVIRIW